MLVTRLPSKPATMVFVQTSLAINVAVPPAVYSCTDSGITRPAREALVESRKSGLTGSLDSLAKSRAVPLAMNFERTVRNPALPLLLRTNPPGQYSPTLPDVKLRFPDCTFDPPRIVTA